MVNKPWWRKALTFGIGFCGSICSLNKACLTLSWLTYPPFFRNCSNSRERRNHKLISEQTMKYLLLVLCLLKLTVREA